jgi:hypothetical protein
LALSVPLSRSTSRVGGGSAFFVRPRGGFGFYFAGLAGEDSSSSIWMSKISAVRLGLARAGSHGEQVRSLPIGERLDLPVFIMNFTFSWPNKSPEPTAVGAVRSAVAVHVASRRWLSFLR